ncbi:MAG: hypothetical protein NUV97_00570 [archaeon]|nr:hypothetical protein [archaeon]
MKFLADTAKLEDIEYCFSRGVNDGITTNPMIMTTTGDLTGGFEAACKRITDKYPNVPVSLETDLRGIGVGELEERSNDVKDVLLKQAERLAAIGKNVVIKIPICRGGLEATTELAARGIQTNVTACMTPYQALEAARAGGTYVSMFANRILDTKILELAGYDIRQIGVDPRWKEVLKAHKERFFDEAWDQTLDDIAYVAKKLDGTGSQLIIGSIRSPEDIRRIVRAEPQVITIPTGIVRGLTEDISQLKETKRSITPSRTSEGPKELSHPMTKYTLDEFERAADQYRKN